jgi:hypothetical protein
MDIPWIYHRYTMDIPYIYIYHTHTYIYIYTVYTIHVCIHHIYIYIPSKGIHIFSHIFRAYLAIGARKPPAMPSGRSVRAMTPSSTASASWRWDIGSTGAVRWIYEKTWGSIWGIYGISMVYIYIYGISMVYIPSIVVNYTIL